jgi:hypothetical protein
MADLLETESGFVLKANGRQVFAGSFSDCCRIAYEALEIDFEQLEAAVSSMTANGHRRAHFGNWGTFIFSATE